MNTKEVSASDFQANCLKLIAEVEKGGGNVTITKRGRPVAVLKSAPSRPERTSIIGALKGSVLHYDAPTDPAIDADEWAASR